MNTHFITQKNPHLIVYFAGWNSPISTVSHLILPKNYDLLICYNYQDLNLLFDFTSYQTIRVIAWSMGVWVAERIMHPYSLTSATAINGTGQPMHDQLGIPTRIFEQTLAELTPESRKKFERRMCGSTTCFDSYQKLPDTRDFSEIKGELSALYTMIKTDNKTDLIQWQKAIIGQKDKIFPLQNQLNYWQQRCQITLQQSGHYLFQQFTHWEQLW